MARNYEGSDSSGPDPERSNDLQEQIAREFAEYLASVDNSGGIEEISVDFSDREPLVQRDDHGLAVEGAGASDDPIGAGTTSELDELACPSDGQDIGDPFEFWAKELGDESTGEQGESRAGNLEGHFSERVVPKPDALTTLRERSKTKLAEIENPADEAEAVNAASQRTMANAIELLDVPYMRGAAYAQALTDVSRFAHEQGDVDSVRAVQSMLQKMPDNGSQSIEYTEANRARATAFYHGLSLGDLGSEQGLSQLLEREKEVAAQKGGLEHDSAIRGAALIRVAEECIQRGVPPEAYVDRYAEDPGGRWAVTFEALKNVAQAGSHESASQTLQAHLRELTNRAEYSDEFLRSTIPQALQHAVDPALKVRLLDRYNNMDGREQSYEIYHQLTEMAETLLADDRFMQAHPGELHYLNERIQGVAQTRLHEGSGTEGSHRQIISRSSGEIEIATQVWNGNSLETVSREIETRKGQASDASERELKMRHSVDAQGKLSEGVQQQVDREAESQADAMRAMASLQFFKKGNLEACSGVLSDVTDSQTRLDTYFVIWSEATTDQIVHTAPLEVAMAEDPSSPLFELYETALTLASWSSADIAARFEALSNTVNDSSEARQLMNNHIKLRHAQAELLLDRLTRLDPQSAQTLARKHLPYRQAGYADFKGHRALEPYYRAITAPGSAEAYAEVAGHIRTASLSSEPLKLVQLANYAVQQQRTYKTLRSNTVPDGPIA